MYLCKCHFVADDFTSGSLKFGSKPYGARTVQQQITLILCSAHRVNTSCMISKAFEGPIPGES